jgi:hypothetical protein
MFGERFFRTWELYLAISEASFRTGMYVNYQLQLTKRIDSLPFTRDYMVSQKAVTGQTTHLTPEWATTVVGVPAYR